MTLPAVFLSRPLAHRAYHDKTQGRPENSAAAVRAAVAAGYGIEIDVQPSSDGVAMVFHDETLDRLTAQTGPINARKISAIAIASARGVGASIRVISAQAVVRSARWRPSVSNWSSR